MEQSYEEFIRNLQHPTGQKKNFKVTDSWGIYDAYKHIRKNHWYNIGRPVTEKEFYSIIRNTNKMLADEAAKGKTVKFPHRMGELELRKYERGVSMKNGKLKVTYLPNWQETFKLWYNDEEARKDKIVLRYEEPYLYSIRYNKHNACYENKGFYGFSLNTFIRRALKDSIKNNIIDTIW